MLPDQSVESKSSVASSTEVMVDPVTSTDWAFRKVCVLVADSDANLRLLLMCWLRRAGHPVIEAADVGQLVDYAANFRPLLIVLGSLGSDQDGLDTYRRIKGDPDTSEIPIIVMPANAETRRRIEVLKLGVEDYSPKPLDLKTLMVRIRAAVQRCAVRTLFNTTPNI